MTFPLFRRPARRRPNLSRLEPHGLSPHLMRDIGLEPPPDRPPLPLFHFW